MSRESVVLLQTHFNTRDDPRVVPRCKRRLLDIVAMAVCAMIGGADDWESIAQFAQADKTKKASTRGKRRIAGWDEEYLVTLLKTLAV